MKLSWRDVLTSILAIAGAIVVFAKLQSYSWWLIGSWRSALAVVGAIGFAILLVNILELLQMEDVATFAELSLWLITATIVIASLVITTTKGEFIVSAAAIGLSWFVELVSHLWGSVHSHRPHYAGA